MSRYRIDWNTDHASDSFPERYTSKRAAEQAARDWKREMVALDPCPRAARAEYQWEVVCEEDEPDESEAYPGQNKWKREGL
jgi:hypothetical protein